MLNRLRVCVLASIGQLDQLTTLLSNALFHNLCHRLLDNMSIGVGACLKVMMYCHEFGNKIKFK